jgi:hypothetical protein
MQLLTGAIAVPAAPAAVTAVTVASAACVRLNWQPAAGAASYEVWRSATNDPGTAVRVASGLPWALGYDYPPASGPYFYWVRAVNQSGASALSGAATIAYTYALPISVPAFGANPAVSPIVPGSTGPMTITVPVSGNPAPALQWQVSYDNGYYWRNITDGPAYSGSTTATLTLLRPTVGMVGVRYRVVGSNSVASNVVSGSVTLTATPPIYRGYYSGNIASGGFWALYVRDNRNATFLASLDVRHSAIIVRSLMVAPDGSFSAAGTEIKPLATAGVTAQALAAAEAPVLKTAAAAGDFSLTGQIAADGRVTGQLAGIGESLFGQAESAEGTTQALTGYYTATALDTAVGSFDVLVGSSGQVFSVRTGATFAEGFRGNIGANGQGSLSAPLAFRQGTIALAIDAAAQTVSGVLTPVDSAQTISYSRLADTVAPVARVVNLSVRTTAGTGDQTLIVGLVIIGSGNKTLLLRGIGPTLSTQGVTNPLADPTMRLLNVGGTEVSANNDWGGSAPMSRNFAAVGAFALPADSKDAALFSTLATGLYSFHLFPNGAGTGVTLAEVYDADDNSSAASVFNISARTQVGTGENILIAGFVITGNSPKTLLIRGLGPTLAAQGVTGALVNPQLYLFGGSGLVGSNDDWGGTAALKNAFAAVGAGALAADTSKDAALLVTLQPGVYSAQVSGVGSTTGVGLVEIFLVP